MKVFMIKNFKISTGVLITMLKHSVTQLCTKPYKIVEYEIFYQLPNLQMVRIRWFRKLVWNLLFFKERWNN